MTSSRNWTETKNEMVHIRKCKMHYNKIVNEDEKKRFRESEKFYVVIYMSFENADDSYSRNRPPEWWLEEEKEPNF